MVRSGLYLFLRLLFSPFVIILDDKTVSLLFIHALWISQRACGGSVHGNRASASVQGIYPLKRRRPVQSELLQADHSRLFSSSGPDSQPHWLVFCYSSGCFGLQPQRQTGTETLWWWDSSSPRLSVVCLCLFCWSCLCSAVLLSWVHSRPEKSIFQHTAGSVEWRNLILQITLTTTRSKPHISHVASVSESDAAANIVFIVFFL